MPSKKAQASASTRDPNKIGKGKALRALCTRQAEFDQLRPFTYRDPKMQEWLERMRTTLRHVFGDDSDQDLALVRVNFEDPSLAVPNDYEDDIGPRAVDVHLVTGLQEAHGLLRTWIDEVESFWPDDDAVLSAPPRDAISLLLTICDRFPTAARRLRTRRAERAPLLIADEYDVQYLLGALLDVHFDDIRPEEWSPTYAGGASRIDYVLRPERVAIETKMTRETLSAKSLGEELIVDIARYAANSSIEALVCFVYDPDHRLPNPRGLERDLEAIQSRLIKRVLIRS